MVFDSQDNLIWQDHMWNRVWVLNFDSDSVWLCPWPPAPSKQRGAGHESLARLP